MENSETTESETGAAGTEGDAASGRRDDAGLLVTASSTAKKVTVEVAMRLPSGANLREHWAEKAQRNKKTRLWTRRALMGRPGREWLAYLRSLGQARGVACTLTRLGPRQLDSDNLQSAFKSVRDEVAELVGVDDGRDWWRWTYAQEPGQGGFRVELEVLP